MVKRMWFSLSLFVVVLFAISTLTYTPTSKDSAATSTNVSPEDSFKPKNIIFLIGDGMSVSTMTAYRHYSDDLSTPEIDDTVFDHYLVGQQKTHSADENENITDSAAAATALATGEKTYNSGVGVDVDGENLPTVLETAKENGKSTGIVVTSELTHATPASFSSRHTDREQHSEIADTYIDDTIDGTQKLDVLLGGGSRYFIREDRNIVTEFQKKGYDYVTSKEELVESDADSLLGLFADEGLPLFIDQSEEVPSLKDMTETALDKLSKNEEGFFLLIEGSQIDWAGHANDITSMMSEMSDFESAFEAAINFAKTDGETLVLATADHGTGGFSMGIEGEYNWDSEPIRQMHPPKFLAQKIVEEGTVEDILERYVDWTFEAEEIEAIKTALSDENPSRTIRDIISSSVDKRSYTGWTTDAHTGDDVNVYAFGPKSELWNGLSDNTDFGKHLFSLLE